MRNTICLLILTIAAAVPAFPADATATRLIHARSVLDAIMMSEHNISMDQLMATDCVVVVPDFKKGAVVVGVGYGRGFVSCRTETGWSAPGAITLESASLGVQLGGEKIDIVILSLDKSMRKKLLAEHLTFGSDASAAWGNGKAEHQGPNDKILFFGRAKGVFAGFGLDGATLKCDESTNTVLYGKMAHNEEVVGGRVEIPERTKPLIMALTRDAER
jgi:lipid-binding SYLF domain-containing protein